MSENDQEPKKVKHPKGRRWPFRIKVQAVEEIDSGQLTIEEAKAKYGFSSRETISWWRKCVERGKPKSRKRIPISVRWPKKNWGSKSEKSLVPNQTVRRMKSSYSKFSIERQCGVFATSRLA